MARQNSGDKLKNGGGQHLDARSCELVAQFFSVLGHPTRVAIVCELRDGPKTVSDLADLCGVSLPNISQHLRTMRDKGALTAEKKGQCVYYSIVDKSFVMACQMIRDALVEHMQARADAFGTMPEP